MMKLGSYASKIRKRIKQEDIEEDSPNSLSAKAFRRRILNDESFVETPLTSGGLLSQNSANRVAVYQPASNSFLRSLLKMSLVFVLPVLALATIVWIVVGIVQENAVTARPIEAESLVLENVPIPAGSRPLGRSNKAARISIAEATLGRVLPNYNILKQAGVAAFISPKPVKELLTYYEEKLLKTKAWQGYGNLGSGGEITMKLYLKGLPTNIPNSLEALLISLEKVDSIILKEDPLYYDRQTNLNETVILITKTWVAPR